MPSVRARHRRAVGAVLVAAALLVGGLVAPAVAAGATVVGIGVRDDGSLVVRLFDSSTLWVQVTVRSPQTGEPLLVTDALQAAEDGWVTDAPVRLGDSALGDYPVDVDYRTSAGPVEHWTAAEHGAAAQFHYVRHARIQSAAFDREITDYDHRTVDLVGRVVAWDPVTGTDVAPAAGTQVHLAYTRVAGTVSGPRTAVAAVDASGDYSLPVTPDGALRLPAVTVSSPQGASETATGRTTELPDVGPEAIRVRMAGSPEHVRVHAGRPVTFSGSAQRLTPAGWRPLAGAVVVTRADGPDPYTYSTSGRIGAGRTDAAGRYAYRATATRTVSVSTYAVTSDYLNLTAFPVSEIAVPTAGAYSGVALTLDQYREVRAKGRLRGRCGQERVLLQYSRTGRGGWSSIGAVRALDSSGGSCAFAVSGTGGVDGYYRLANAESDQLLATSSRATRLRRTQTRITSFSTTPKRPAKKARLTASGNLSQSVSGHWRALRGTVGVVWRPKGERDFYLMAKARTNSGGHFSVSATAYGDGAWAVVYYADRTHFYSETGLRNVDVR